MPNGYKYNKFISFLIKNIFFVQHMLYSSYFIKKNNKIYTIYTELCFHSFIITN